MHDELGQLVASRPEPEWDDDQRAWVLALAELEADTCSGCRQPLAESTEQDPWGAPGYAYEVPAPTRCHACTALEGAQKNAESSRALLYQVRGTKKPPRG